MLLTASTGLPEAVGHYAARYVSWREVSRGRPPDLSRQQAANS